MYQLVLIVHIVAAACIIALVLVQQGKGATTGAAFGSGASQTMFGSRGSGSFLLKVTIGLAGLFFVTSIAMNYMAAQAVKQEQQTSMSLPEIPGSDTAVPPASPSSIPSLPAAPQPIDEKK